MTNKVKEINNNVSIYLEIDETKLEVLDEGLVKYKNTYKVESCGDLAHALLEELIESNPDLLRKYGFNKVNFYIQESKTQEIEGY